MLFPEGGMCYKHAFEGRSGMPQPNEVNHPADQAESQTAGSLPKQEPEIASAFCPSCSARLAQRSCKLICPACGYYMSCSDFY
jgi:hypothetical protein